MVLKEIMEKTNSVICRKATRAAEAYIKRLENLEMESTRSSLFAGFPLKNEITVGSNFIVFSDELWEHSKQVRVTTIQFW